MNATKRLLTGAAIAAGALGIGAGVFFACRQELSPGAQSETPVERKAGDANFTDGNYRFYFVNGRSISGDCDGYNTNIGAGGKTTIYEWLQTDINDWVKRLKNAGIEHEVFRNNWTKYCWVRFDTKQLKAIGMANERDSRAVSTVIKDGKHVFVPSKAIRVESGNRFYILMRAPLTVFHDSPVPEAVKTLESIGVKVLDTDGHNYITIDANGVFIAQNYDPSPILN